MATSLCPGSETADVARSSCGQVDVASWVRGTHRRFLCCGMSFPDWGRIISDKGCGTCVLLIPQTSGSHTDPEQMLLEGAWAL